MYYATSCNVTVHVTSSPQPSVILCFDFVFCGPFGLCSLPEVQCVKIFKLTVYAEGLLIWLSIAADPIWYMTHQLWMSKMTSIAWAQLTIRTCTSIWTSWVTLSSPRSLRQPSCNLVPVKRPNMKCLHLMFLALFYSNILCPDSVGMKILYSDVPQWKNFSERILHL
jgi:hypothetical protein